MAQQRSQRASTKLLLSSSTNHLLTKHTQADQPQHPAALIGHAVRPGMCRKKSRANGFVDSCIPQAGLVFCDLVQSVYISFSRKRVYISRVSEGRKLSTAAMSNNDDRLALARARGLACCRAWKIDSVVLLIHDRCHTQFWAPTIAHQHN